MKSKIVWLCFLWVGLLLVGCPAKPPKDELKSAMDEIQKARTELADKCAKEELEAAQKMLEKAQAYMKKEDYDNARLAFELAKKLALKAKEAAKRNRPECEKKMKQQLAKKDSDDKGLLNPPKINSVEEKPVVDDRKSLETIYFEFNKHALTDQAQTTLTAHVEWLKKAKSTKVEVAGHCDQRGSVEYNLALGEKRALSVKTFMVGLGIDKSRISVISYGHQKPTDPRQTKEAYDKNRRAEFKVSKEE